MFLEEAEWIRRHLGGLALGPDHRVLDIGSSTETFRRLHQPFIDFHIFLPLRRAGVRVVHVDQRLGDGVDVRCDLADPAQEREVAQLEPADAVLCCNLLEHVLDRELVLRRARSLVRPGGVLVLTVPFRYRYHEDPIDTMYRPSPDELVGLFQPPWRPQAADVVEVEAEAVYGRRLTVPERAVNKLLRSAGRSPRFRRRKTRNQVSCVVMVRGETGAEGGA
ncbi:MAG: methyltransferase domain-containing protein [Acidobacteriota bacterium]